MTRQFMTIALALLVSSAAFGAHKGSSISSRIEEIQEHAMNIKNNTDNDMIQEQAQHIHDKAGKVHTAAKHENEDEIIGMPYRDNKDEIIGMPYRDNKRNNNSDHKKNNSHSKKNNDHSKNNSNHRKNNGNHNKKQKGVSMTHETSYQG